MITAATDFTTIKRTSTADHVAGAIRDRILGGELAPGTPLREVALAGALGVSRNSLREGIRILIAEGLLTHNVHRGVAVTAITPQDVRDIYFNRRLIESAAVRARSARKKETLAGLDQTIRELDRAIEADDNAAVVDLDFRFHRQLVASLGSARLSAFYGSTLAELRLALFVLDREEGEWRDWIAHHREILEALRSGRPGECVKLIERHLEDAQERLLGIVDP